MLYSMKVGILEFQLGSRNSPALATRGLQSPGRLGLAELCQRPSSLSLPGPLHHSHHVGLCGFGHTAWLASSYFPV